MAHVDCPKCSQRLRVPDSDEPLTLRCPACGSVFDNGMAEEDESDEPLRPSPAVLSPARQAPGNGSAAATATAATETADPDTEGNQHILSAADEAMLKDFGSGSGLLELTREAYEVSPKLDVHHNGDGQVSPPAPVSGEHDRQFQIVTTALTLANKLSQTHKAELHRSRRNGQLAWILVGALTVAAAGLLGWGISNLGKVYVEQNNVSNLNKTLDQDRARASADVQAAKGEASKCQADLAAAREQLAESKAAAVVLGAALKEANASLAALNGKLGASQAELAAAKTQSAKLAGDLEAAKAQSEKLAAELEAVKSETDKSATTQGARPVLGP